MHASLSAVRRIARRESWIHIATATCFSFVATLKKKLAIRYCTLIGFYIDIYWMKRQRLLCIREKLIQFLWLHSSGWLGPARRVTTSSVCVLAEKPKRLRILRRGDRPPWSALAPHHRRKCYRGNWHAPQIYQALLNQCFVLHSLSNSVLPSWWLS